MTQPPQLKDMPWKTNAPIARVTKQIYVANEAKGRAPMVFPRYTGMGLERYELHCTEVRDDVPEARKYRTSPDNGRTWSPFTPLPAIPQICKGVEVLNHLFQYAPFDPDSGVSMGVLLRQINHDKLWNNFSSAMISRDGGITWLNEQPLRYEEGLPFDPENPLNPGFLLRNQGYPGNNILFHSNGTRILFLCFANTPDDPGNDTRMFKNGAVCMIGRWDAGRGARGAGGDYRWEAGARTFVLPTQSGRGLAEPEAIELSDGRLLVVFRGDNLSWDGSKDVTEPGRKWYCISSDGGRTLSPLADWRYDDGTQFYSPSSYHRTLRHSVNGKLYWLGNICATLPEGDHPRYPLILAEIDDRTGLLKKKTVTALDDRKPGQQAVVQYSNFTFLEDHETHDMEIYLTAYSEFEGEDWRTANCYRYTVTPV